MLATATAVALWGSYLTVCFVMFGRFCLADTEEEEEIKKKPSHKRSE